MAKSTHQEKEASANTNANFSIINTADPEIISAMTENSALAVVTTSTTPTNASHSTSVASSCVTQCPSPHKVGTSITEAPSPQRRNLRNFHYDSEDENGYDSDGAVGPFYDAIDIEGDQYFENEDEIPERYYDPDFDVEIYEYGSENDSAGVDGVDDLVELPVAGMVNEDSPTDDPIEIQRDAAFQTLVKKKCDFCEVGPPTNYYCQVESRNGKRILDGKRICGSAFCVLCREKWGISDSRLRICNDCYNKKPESGGDVNHNEPAMNTGAGEFVGIEEGQLMSMNCNTLKEELRKRKLKVSGSKKQLQERLRQGLADKVPIGGVVTETVQNQGAKKKKEKKSEFPSTAYWDPLTPLDEAEVEPSNPSFKSQTTRAPTVEKEDEDYISIKHSFGETWNRPPFEGKYEEFQRTRRGNIRRDREGNVLKETVERRKGRVREDFLKKHGLTHNSVPADFVAPFLPFKKNKYSTARKEQPSFELFTRWTNLKANLVGAGEGGTCYPDWQPFTARELRQHLGLYIFNGLSPSPQVELKFKPHAENPVHGNDFIYHSFGPNALRRHRHFKTFLAMQDPAIKIPCRTKYPNWKVRPLLKWMNFLFPLIWMLGVCFAIDEMTIGFQGMHIDKKRITYKAEGDGFQADALCDDGFCYQFYFRNDPADVEYRKTGLSPLHSRVMSLFDTVNDKYHVCGMDNLYNSTTFCKRAWNHTKKVKVHGVTRKGMRGIPSCVVQNEEKARKKQLMVRGTTKAAVLKGDPDCPDLIATSVYDTKPVHYLSMACEQLKWVVCQKMVYNVDTGAKECLQFLRMSNINEYNHQMGDVDIADQLRNNYRFDHWLRKRKWWWSIMMWALGVMLVNAYIVYMKVNLAEGKNKSELLSQHDFRLQVAMAWISPEVYWGGEKDGPARTTWNKRQCRSVPVNYNCDDDTADQSYAPVKLRSAKLHDNALRPNGQLSIRLDKTKLHCADKAKGRARCSLHRWLGFETQKHISYCETCNVNLCQSCFKYFHITHDITSEKDTLKRKFEKEHKELVKKRETFTKKRKEMENS